MSDLDIIDTYPIVHYDTVLKAKDAYLDAYFGDGCFEREMSARLAGVEQSSMEQWHLDPLFFKRVERRLQLGSKRRSSMQETLLNEVQNIMEGNIADVFEQTEDGNLIIKNIKTLPRYVTAAIKQMDVIRTSVPGRPAEFTECLRIVMHDKTKVMNIAGDFTDVKNKALKNVDSGGPKMVGMSLSIAPTTRTESETALEEQTNEHESISERGEVSDDPQAEGGTSAAGDLL